MQPKHSILILLGLFMLSVALFVSQHYSISDSTKGFLYGIALGMLLLSFGMNRKQHTNKSK
ncbi:hypothetical protein [Flavobacterium sp. GCM10027622]|uniref:hypothetical protein n=1 Tax=unclassified Flavobacterium TaxID=196869 RepID=UPI0036176CD0